jgi:hypothetical protein
VLRGRRRQTPFPRRPFRAKRLRELARRVALGAAFVLSLAIAREALAQSPATSSEQSSANRVVVEVDTAAERWIDARAVRRLIRLELADVEVPAAPDVASSALFYRVLGDARGFIELELWERGTLHGNRRVSSAERGGHLFARRVALAAAELARSLRQQRLARRRLEARRRARERDQRARLHARTLEGPIALRAGVLAGRGEGQTTFGSGLTLGATLLGATRLDLGARWLGTELDHDRGRWTALELSLGPAHRFRLTPALDLDAGALLTAAVLRATGVRGVDAIAGQDETWTARAAVALRLEPRLSRAVRASFGVEGGHLLRAIPLTLADGQALDLRGPYAQLELGLVLTPESADPKGR